MSATSLLIMFHHSNIWSSMTCLKLSSALAMMPSLMIFENTLLTLIVIFIFTKTSSPLITLFINHLHWMKFDQVILNIVLVVVIAFLNIVKEKINYGTLMEVLRSKGWTKDNIWQVFGNNNKPSNTLDSPCIQEEGECMPDLITSPTTTSTQLAHNFLVDMGKHCISVSLGCYFRCKVILVANLIYFIRPRLTATGIVRNIH